DRRSVVVVARVAFLKEAGANLLGVDVQGHDGLRELDPRVLDLVRLVSRVGRAERASTTPRALVESAADGVETRLALRAGEAAAARRQVVPSAVTEAVAAGVGAGGDRRLAAAAAERRADQVRGAVRDDVEAEADARTVGVVNVEVKAIDVACRRAARV